MRHKQLGPQVDDKVFRLCLRCVAPRGRTSGSGLIQNQSADLWNIMNDATTAYCHFLSRPRRHNQQSLEVQKDPDHKNRCRVHFPEVFSTMPYKVIVTAVNALGKASTTISFEESSIGKTAVRPPTRVAPRGPALTPSQSRRAR